MTSDRNLFDVKGKIVFVTGASSGIGRSAATCLAEAGAKVIGIARRLDKLKEWSQEAKGETSFFSADVSNKNEVKTIVHEIIKINDQEFIVSSTIEKEKFEEFFSKKLNCPEAESLGGYVLKEFGHLPKVGEKILVDNLEMTVTSADQRKIKKITVRKVD